MKKLFIITLVFVLGGLAGLKITCDIHQKDLHEVEKHYNTHEEVTLTEIEKQCDEFEEDLTTLLSAYDKYMEEEYPEVSSEEAYETDEYFVEWLSK